MQKLQMVRSLGPTSSEINDLFQTLSDWEDILQADSYNPHHEDADDATSDTEERS